MVTHASAHQRRTSLTEAAIDYAISCGSEIWETSGEDAEQFADMAIQSTLETLGRPSEDHDSFDRPQVIRAIRIEFDPGFEAEAKAGETDTDLTPSKLEALAVLQARSGRSRPV